MKKWVSLFVLGVAFQAVVAADLGEIRQAYLQAVNLKGIQRLEGLITSSAINKPVLKAYAHAVVLMSLAHRYHPLEKYLLFKEHTTAMDLLLEEYPEELEIRLLRYSIQTNSPSFLGYKQDRENDLRILESALRNLPKDQRKYMNQVIKGVNDE